MSVKNTQTEKNLLTAFAGESQARNRYTYFASKARKEGYRQIAEIFEETANQEREHAKRFFKFLEGGEVEVTASFPAGVVADTVTNLGGGRRRGKLRVDRDVPRFRQGRPEGGFRGDRPGIRSHCNS